MQYFSFIGMGDKDNGYREVYYSFESNPEHAVLSRFVQELIINYHLKDLDEVFIFATKESRERYENDLNELFREKVDIKFIDISRDITYEEFTSKLLKYMKDNEDVVLDITHSFRHIPMKLLFALKYIELTKNVHIQHLYYGLLKKDDTGEVVDFVEDYRMQQISDLLAQFNRTLMISGKDIDNLIEEKSDKINNFLRSLNTFNRMIEYCEFDNSLKEIRKITESCTSIIKDEDRYSLIIPIVKQIKDKFDFYNKYNNDIDKKEELIKVLICHQRMQVAITFIDQFFREELIRNTLDPLNKKFNLDIYLKNKNISNINKSSIVYELSQYLRKDVYNLTNRNDYSKYRQQEEFENSSNVFNGNENNKYGQLLKDKENEIEYIKKILTEEQKEIIYTYFNEIRNHMNHGISIQIDIEPILNKMLDSIRLIGRRGK